jgi:ABC-2 type transport system ATP-binding protein
MWNLIRELVDRGTTILLTTQYLDEADELADRIAVIDEGEIIAEGTADELKSRVGNDVLELKIIEDARLDTAIDLLQPIAVEKPQANEVTDTITLPVSNGTHSLVQAVRELDQAGIELQDMHLRRPSLDDVFLALTGKTSREKAEAEAVLVEGD